MLASQASAAAATPEELDSFLLIRRHVKRLQVGTPLLLRTEMASGQEELSICTFSVTKDLQLLKWQDQEGTGTVHEAPIASIISVAEDTSPPEHDTDDDSHHALTLLVKRAHADEPQSMVLICASREDLESWREGLQFLVSSNFLPPTPAAARARGLPASVGASQAEQELSQKLLQEKEANEKLRKENAMLREALRRKDSTIADLKRNMENRPTGSGAWNKTENTSRESDEHLRDREVAILRRKNARLRKDLNAKQKTVADLLQLVGRVTAQQGAESSAVEDEDDNDSCLDAPASDNVLAGASARGGGTRGAAVAAASARALATEAGDEETDGSSEPGAANQGRQPFQPPPRAAPAPFQPPPRAAPAATPVVRPVVQSPVSKAPMASPKTQAGRQAAQQRQAAPASPAAGAGSGSSPELPSELASLLGELGGSGSALAGLLGGLGVAEGGASQLLQSLLQGLGEETSPESSPERPPARATFATTAPATSPTSTAAARGLSSAGGRPTNGHSAAAAPGPRSTAALEALTKELELLEEKKRVVERLAKQLEPASDGEDDEDDGFPLR